MAISNAMSTSMISASNSMKIAKIQKGVKSSMDGQAGVLKAEIAQDGARGGDVEKKKAQLEAEEEKSSKVKDQTMNTLSDMNDNMKKAAKADAEETKAREAAEKKEADKKQAKKAAEKKQAEKKAQEERIEKLAEKNSSLITGEEADEITNNSETNSAITQNITNSSIDVEVDGVTPSNGTAESVGVKVDVSA